MTQDDAISPGDTHSRPLPRHIATIGMWLFLASLTMLFTGSLLAYILIRLGRAHHPPDGYAPVPLGSLRLPPELWGSTALVLGVSIALWAAVREVRREHQRPFRAAIGVALGLAGGFVAVQAPAMLHLLAAGRALEAGGAALYRFIFVLILVHALHVVGGIAALGTVVVRGLRGAYDHEHYGPVQFATMYWHFLDGVWIVLFATFLLTR